MLHLPPNQPLPEESFSGFEKRSIAVAESDSAEGARQRGDRGGDPVAADQMVGFFGHYLQMARIERQVSLAEVSRRTRIGVDVLRAIENEDLKRLPEEVFVKGFLRSYAREVGVDGELAVQRYVACVHAAEERERFDRRLLTRGSGLVKKMAVVLLPLAALIAVSVFLVSEKFTFQTGHSGPAPLKPAVSQTGAGVRKQTSLGKVSHAHDAPQLVADSAPERNGTRAAKGRYLLKVLAVEDTWMKVIADDRAPRRYRLHPGDRLELRASSGFNLLVGNAAGVKMDFNGRPLDLYGKSGQTVTLQLP